MNWRDLNTYIKDMSEASILRGIKKELKGARRRTILIRLHQRYSILRTAREREELLAKAVAE